MVSRHSIGAAVTLAFFGIAAGNAFARPETLQSVITPFSGEATSPEGPIVLKNDSFVDGGGQAYLQMGFVAGEKAGVWVKVPEAVPYFKVEHFRVLYGSSQERALTSNQIFFQMAVESQPGPAIPWQIENAAQITPGPYWNDIPAQGEPGTLRCARGGEFVGASLEFVHNGAPSVYRDLDGLADMRMNVLFAVPGGWNYSAAYGLRGDWILRVVGREASAAECGAEE